MRQLLSAAALTIASAAVSATAATVYTETNSASGNALQIFRTGSGGALALSGSISTGGLGTGAGLGNQGALALSRDGRWLFAVNAGSNDISVFAVEEDDATLVARVNSGGVGPVSITVHGNLLYVLNAGGTGNIAGFHVSADGHVRAIADSARPLSSATAGAAQVEFGPGGGTLVVTEKATNRISLYTVDDGRATGPFPQPSHGMTPFGFAIDPRGTLLVSEANAGALSSYEIADELTPLEVISGSVPTNQTAACWVVVARHGHYAYVTNTGSGTVTGYSVSRSGELARLSADGISGVTGGGPTDATVTRDGEILFVLSPSIGQIVTFQVMADGSLVKLANAPGVAGTATGLIVR
jgi:6-phosphogluconolactonase (cycloisomerase 2 family)